MAVNPKVPNLSGGELKGAKSVLIRPSVGEANVTNLSATSHGVDWAGTSTRALATDQNKGFR